MKPIFINLINFILIIFFSLKLITQIQVKHYQNMIYRTIQQEIDQLIDRSDHPNIAHRDDIDAQLLSNVRKLPISEKQSIQIMKDVLEAIIYISSHLLTFKPCQVFKEHIIYNKNKRWGLCNIICYRDPDQNSEFDPDRYYPIDYDFHPDQDSQLLWSLGRMWFQLITNSRIPPIKTLNQKQLTNMVDTNIKQAKIRALLGDILVIDTSKRLDLVTVIKHGLFEYEQKSKIFLHSVMPNLSQVQQQSKFIMSNNKFQSNIKKNVIYNPFQQQLYKRDFKQSIIIADLIQKVKQFIYTHFQVSENSHEIHFSCYLIDLFSYQRLNGLKLKRQQSQYLIVLLYDKHDYTRFLQKLLELEDKIQRKRKMKKFQKFREQYPRLLQNPSNFTPEDEKFMYFLFKTYLMKYAKIYKEISIKNGKITECQTYITLIQMMLVRASNYVFTNCRKQIFGDFIKPNQKLEIGTVLSNIQKCENIELLQKLQKKILQLYFSPNQNE